LKNALLSTDFESGLNGLCTQSVQSVPEIR
jgi:hypothetical protein